MNSLLAFPANYTINVGASLKNVLHVLGCLPASDDGRPIRGELADILTYFVVSRLPINADANQINIPADESGNLYLGIRDDKVDKYGEPLRPDYYSDNRGSFSVDIIVWEREDWVQVADFFEKMKEKDPGNKAIIDAISNANRYGRIYLASREASKGSAPGV